MKYGNSRCQNKKKILQKKIRECYDTGVDFFFIFRAKKREWKAVLGRNVTELCIFYDPINKTGLNETIYEIDGSEGIFWVSHFTFASEIKFARHF